MCVNPKNEFLEISKQIFVEATYSNVLVRYANFISHSFFIVFNLVSCGKYNEIKFLNTQFLPANTYVGHRHSYSNTYTAIYHISGKFCYNPPPLYDNHTYI